MLYPVAQLGFPPFEELRGTTLPICHMCEGVFEVVAAQGV